MSFDRTKTLTLFGRKPVLEALADNSISVRCVHLSDRNKPSDELAYIHKLAAQRGCEIKTHNKLALSRISKNGKQDQGVAADIYCDNFYSETALTGSGTYIAVDRIGNPQNLGMLIRSVAASGIAGLVLAEDAGNTKITPLVVKASAGTVFKCDIYKCRNLLDTCRTLAAQGFQIVCMDGRAETSLNTLKTSDKTLFILGNETDGIRQELIELAHQTCRITMHNGVESLNVAVAGSLVAFGLAGA